MFMHKRIYYGQGNLKENAKMILSKNLRKNKHTCNWENFKILHFE